MKKKYKLRIPVFDIINALLMILLSLIFIIPFWLILTSSLSDNSALLKNGISFRFQGFSLDGYRFLFSMSDLFLHSLLITILVATLTSILSVIVCTLGAYVLSKKYFVGRKFLNVFFMITMFFSGGTIPTFLVIRGIGIYDTIWALILPGVCSTYSILLLRNFFYSVPTALEEAAQIDGANDLQIFLKIYFPLAIPMMLTVGIMTFVGQWNSWLPSLLYLGANNSKLWTIQYVLRQMLTNMQSLYGSSSSGAITNAPLISAKNAAIVITVLPLILLSPILHKYFSKGIVEGSVKG